jgi:hypothetical protein
MPITTPSPKQTGMHSVSSSITGARRITNAVALRSESANPPAMHGSSYRTVGYIRSGPEIKFML